MTIIISLERISTRLGNTGHHPGEEKQTIIDHLTSSQRASIRRVLSNDYIVYEKKGEEEKPTRHIH